jgi:hypothetical protein
MIGIPYRQRFRGVQRRTRRFALFVELKLPAL